MALTDIVELSPSTLVALTFVAICTTIVFRIFYNLYFHPLSKHHGPWYAASFSTCSAIICVLRLEPEWFLSLVKRYGNDKPIRISPSLLLFPQPAALKDIYAEPKCNLKGSIYDTGTLGPPNIVTTLDAETHKALRRALGGPQWSVGGLKKNWESRFDNHVQLFVQRMTERIERGQTVVLSDKLSEFAADIMSLVSFTEPWGFVTNSRDERNIISSLRNAMPFFGFVGRCTWFREKIIKASWFHRLLLPTISDDNGIGWLMAQANRHITERERSIEDEGFSQEKPDFLQQCLEARIDGDPLTPAQKLGHITLLIQAGADTTGTALGSTMRFILTHPPVLARVRAELDAAEEAGSLSAPIQFEETRTRLPFFVACIKESLRLNPPTPNLFSRVAPADGIVVDGTYVPAGIEMSTAAYVVQRDPRLYGPDPEAFRPERWLEGGKASEMEAGSFVFGAGPRVCLGKDVAFMELYKLLPEIVRRFDFELKQTGRYVIVGGIARNEGLEVRMRLRNLE